jgi:hypothetical protein
VPELFAVRVPRAQQKCAEFGVGIGVDCLSAAIKKAPVVGQCSSKVIGVLVSGQISTAWALKGHTQQLRI